MTGTDMTELSPEATQAVRQCEAECPHGERCGRTPGHYGDHRVWTLIHGTAQPVCTFVADLLDGDTHD
jgi:hypothetical protein